MTPTRTGIIISLALHGGAFALVFALSSSLAQPNKPTEIDFTIVEPTFPPAPPVPQSEAPETKPETSPPPKNKAEPPVPERPRSAVQRQVPIPQPAPLEPATQPEGSVPVIAEPKKSLPVTTVQPPVATSQETGGGGSSTASSIGFGSGGGDSAEKLGNKYRADNFAYIKKIIEQNLVYPSRAQRLGWGGKCVVQFQVQQNGHAKNIQVIWSTGYELLDDNVIETIKRVEPFPRPPVPVKLTIPFTYQLG